MKVLLHIENISVCVYVCMCVHAPHGRSRISMYEEYVNVMVENVRLQRNRCQPN